ENIVTHCPHSFNTFKKDYLEGEGDYKIYHHTQFILNLIKQDKIKLENKVNKTVTYHDPCFLTKHNDITEAPRKIIESIPGLEFIELPRNKKNSFCCGGGGGRMWMEQPKEEERPNVERAREVADTNADILLTACPFCLVQLEDGMKMIDKNEEIQVIDIGEFVIESIGEA
ncbi:hypothetical protein AKJ40_04665, partial [candidate division MSBL1 archaeon SCGC-AAA259M10]